MEIIARLRQQIEELQRDQQELTCFFDQSVEMQCAASLDGYFLRLSPSWTTTLGWPLDELLAKPFIDFVHPDDRAVTMLEVGKLSEGEETIGFENRYRHRDGSYHWFRWKAQFSLRSERIYATAVNITQRRNLEKKVISAADEEKRRLGQELHDGLCQTLAGIAALSTTLTNRLEASSNFVAANSSSEVTGFLNAAIADVRDMARGLAPVTSIGLIASLEKLAANVEHMHRVPCTIESDTVVPELEPDVATHFFRIAQESLRNAVSHARADRIELSLKFNNGQIQLNVHDDGVGFSGTTPTALHGIGMHTMSQRARLIGASFGVRRRKQGGTTVSCSLTLPDNNEIASRCR